MKATTLFMMAFMLCFSMQVQSQTATTHHGALADNGSLYFKAEPLNNTFTESTDNIYYYVHLQGLPYTAPAVQSRMPLNLSVVIDKSGSMSGNKLAYAKEALKYIINNLNEGDYLSVVLYDSNVEVFYPQQKVKDKDALLERVAGINSGSSTNLEGGIRKGYEMVKTTKLILDSDMIHRVILLSDGLANVGITNSEQLGAITKSFFEEDRISISTFGVGAGYNEDLMANIATQGGGNYYFIDSPEKLPSMFEEELKGMSKVIAQNTQLEITFPYEVLSHKKTYAYNSTVKGNKLSISFNDIFSEEQKSILIVFKKTRKKDPIAISCKLTYENPMSNGMSIVDNRENTVTLAKNKQEHESGFNKAASEGYAMEIAAEMYAEATVLCNQNSFKDAKNKTNEAILFLDKHFQLVGENTYLRKLQTTLKEYKTIIDDFKKMDRVTFSLNIKRQKHYRYRTISCPKF